MKPILSKALRTVSLATLGPLMLIGEYGTGVSGGILGCPFTVPFIMCQACPSPCTFLVASPWLFGGVVVSSFLVGRVFCGLVCPLGFLSAVAYSVPVRKISSVRLDRVLRYLGYGVLAASGYVLYEALKGLLGSTAVTPFWSYMAAGREYATVVAVGLLGAVIVSSMFTYRPFCKHLCPLGRVLSVFNKHSLLLPVQSNEACAECGSCSVSCPAKVFPRTDSYDCMRCFECQSECGADSVQMRRRPQASDSSNMA